MRNVGLPYDFLNPYKKPPIASRRFLTFHGDYRFLSETVTAISTPNAIIKDNASYVLMLSPPVPQGIRETDHRLPLCRIIAQS